jgi:hypothetical protein
MLADKIGMWTENDAYGECVNSHTRALRDGRMDDARALYRCLHAVRVREALIALWDEAQREHVRAQMRAMWDDDRDSPR